MKTGDHHTTGSGLTGPAKATVDDASVVGEGKVDYVFQCSPSIIEISAIELGPNPANMDSP